MTFRSRLFQEGMVNLASLLPAVMLTSGAYGCRDRLRRKTSIGYYADRQNAVRDVWYDALHVWHLAYGQTPSKAVCGACGEVLTPNDRTILIIDGARVHASHECLDGYGERCRQVAHAALVGIGLKPPS